MNQVEINCVMKILGRAVKQKNLTVAKFLFEEIKGQPEAIMAAIAIKFLETELSGMKIPVTTETT